MTTYANGTVSVGANATTMTGVGTAWLTSGIRTGDVLMLAGFSIPVASVNSNTNITLARPWPGSAQSGSNYDILLIDDDVRALAAANMLLQQLTNGTLTSLAGLASTANKLPYFSGQNVMALTDLSAWGRSLIDDADAAAFWATVGATSGPAEAFRRGNVLGTVSQSGGVPTGALIERGSNANGLYTRFADGTQICTHSVNSSASAQTTWTYPAAFASGSTPVTTFGVASSTGILIGAMIDVIGVFSMNFSTRIADNSRVSTSVRLQAVGRWY